MTEDDITVDASAKGYASGVHDSLFSASWAGYDYLRIGHITASAIVGVRPGVNIYQIRRPDKLFLNRLAKQDIKTRHIGGFKNVVSMLITALDRMESIGG